MTEPVAPVAPPAEDDFCYYRTGCRWIDGCNAESTRIGREAAEGEDPLTGRCPSCSRGEDGGGYPCDCPAPCGARYCQHPTETASEKQP